MTIDARSERVRFDAALDLEQVIVRVPDSREMANDVRDAIAGSINRWGFTVIEHGEFDDPTEQVLALGSLFGSTYRHNRADERGIVQMVPSNIGGEYLGATNKEHPLHTDGAYDPTPPPVLALQCVTPATTGGMSTVLSSKALYEHLADRDPEALQALFRPDALHVKRDNQEDTKPVFAPVGDRLMAVWRHDHTSKFASDEDTQRAVSLILEFTSDPANVLAFTLARNQIFLEDNLSVLHGRTAFPPDVPRKLNRVNFLGDAEFARSRVTFGFPA